MPRMRSCRPAVVCAVVIAAVLQGVAPAHATVVASPSLDDLVAEAESIFVGEVVDVRSRWMTAGGRATIVTDVVFSVESVLKGPARVQARLEFLGGAVGDTRIDVEGVPRFRLGDRDVLFVERETGRASALVAVAGGRFRLMRDPQTGEELVAFHDFRPVTDVDGIGSSAPRPVAGRAISLRRFERAVRERAARSRG